MHYSLKSHNICLKLTSTRILNQSLIHYEKIACLSQFKGWTPPSKTRCNPIHSCRNHDFPFGSDYFFLTHWTPSSSLLCSFTFVMMKNFQNFQFNSSSFLLRYDITFCFLNSSFYIIITYGKKRFIDPENESEVKYSLSFFLEVLKLILALVGQNEAFTFDYANSVNTIDHS